MSIRFKSITPQEQPQALELWDATFKPGAGYFQRYFRDDPWYREGDSLGAWDGDRLVSAVHICRRPVEWAGRTLWCGAIANVATDPDYRQRGLSRDLLRQALERMPAEGLDFSMLFTGRFNHYGVLGWEKLETPSSRVRLSRSLSGDEPSLSEEPGIGTLAELYWKVPSRPLLLHRPDRYYQGWVGWNWRQHGVIVLGDPELGCIAYRAEGEEPGTAEVVEWHPMDAEAESLLLRSAALRARREGKTELLLAGVPYYEGLVALAELGESEAEAGGCMMLRNVRLEPEEYAQIRRLYARGDAAWWPSDAF